MVNPEQVEQLVDDLRALPSRGDDFVARCMKRLAALPNYDWVGVYWLRGNRLELGPFVGAPTEHKVIPVGRGVCGTAVAEGRNQLVADVRELENYLACSLETRSEIVVLIRSSDGSILGQIDADGHEVGAFDQSDEELLTKVAELIASRTES